MNKKPLYVKVSENLRNDIKAGKYQSGDKLPSENMLARKYSVSRLTAREGLSVLVNERLIEKYQGKGYFCRSDASGKKIHVLLDMSDFYFLPYYTQSISRILEAHGATFIACDTKYCFEEIVKHLEKILQAGSDGIILEGSPEEDYDKKKIRQLFQKLKEKNIPVILLDTDYGIKNTSVAMMNEEKIGMTAAQYFKNCGHTSVAAVCVGNNRISVKRMGAFAKEFDSCRMIYDDACLAENLLNVYNCGVTAIFCYSDFVAKKCIDAFSVLGISIPDDISLISVDDSLVSKLYNITSITHAKEALGEFAAKAILTNSTIVKKVFDTKLIERSSVKMIKKHMQNT